VKRVGGRREPDDLLGRGHELDLSSLMGLVGERRPARGLGVRRDELPRVQHSGGYIGLGDAQFTRGPADCGATE
jgi:hypothetical protein